MSTPVTLRVEAEHRAARAGVASSPRGEFLTPCFMPVGTRGAVKYLDADDLGALGARVVLANTYHLLLRPGAEVIAQLGGLHGFTGWSGHFLTDSGGYQVFSLEPEVDDDGVRFRSVYDGSWNYMTAESTVRAQELLGADIAMVLDVCPPLPSAPEVVRVATRRTLEWAARARDAHERADQALFGIVQGGLDAELRVACANELTSIGFSGYGIGGFSVGETRAEMLGPLAATCAVLPRDRPRYLMGVGDPASLVEAVNVGVDMFDCVMQTRLGRHGTVLTSAGRLNLKNQRFAASDEPIDPACPCRVCARFSRGYVRHLLQVGEPSASRLCTMHNLAWTFELMAAMRTSIVDGTFHRFRENVLAVWS